MDAYIGGLAESHVEGSGVGELFMASLVDQFTRMRDGDRFYFENTANGLFTEDEIASIHSTSNRFFPNLVEISFRLERYHSSKYKNSSASRKYLFHQRNASMALSRTRSFVRNGNFRFGSACRDPVL